MVYAVGYSIFSDENSQNLTAQLKPIVFPLVIQTFIFFLIYTPGIINKCK